MIIVIKNGLIMNQYEIIDTVRLTVAESKRLIAKGLSMNSAVRAKLEKGMVIITRGTTNTYILEELAGIYEPHGAFVTGKITPANKPDFSKGIDKIMEVVLVDGEPTELSYAEALSSMGDDDIIFKGANLINYDKSQAGICIGAENGGTVGRLREYTDSGKGRWIIPVGLEKDCSGDLFASSEMLDKAENRNIATLLNVTNRAEIYTEIEALKEFADVDVYTAAHGGVDGSEGGVSLIVCGSIEQVAKATAAAESIMGEPNFSQN